MRNSKWALLALSVMIIGTMGVLITACGETDPALAPAGAQVRILGTSAETWEIQCNDMTGLPPFCFDAWVQYLKDKCVNDGGTVDVCETNWINASNEDREDARIAIANNPGACGYNNSIVTAFVELYTSSSGTTSSESEGTTGGTLGGDPMNDIEIRFIAYDGEMYKLSDDPKLLPPLANPYVTRTDDRGKAELKYRVPRPVACGFSYTYRLEADIGVSKASMTVDFSVDEGNTETEEPTDDDDATDDDTTE